MNAEECREFAKEISLKPAHMLNVVNANSEPLVIGQVITEHTGFSKRTFTHPTIALSAETYDKLICIAGEYHAITQPPDVQARKARLWDLLIQFVTASISPVNKVGLSHQAFNITKRIGSTESNNPNTAYSCNDSWGATPEEALTKFLLGDTSVKQSESQEDKVS